MDLTLIYKKLKSDGCSTIQCLYLMDRDKGDFDNDTFCQLINGALYSGCFNRF